MTVPTAKDVTLLGNWEWDIATNKVAWSEGLFRLHGLEPQPYRWTYERFLGTVHPRDRARVRSYIGRAIRSRRPFTYEYRIVRPDGSCRDLLIHGEVLCDERGRPVRMLGTAVDVTEHRAVVRRLRESEEKYRQLFSGARDAILTVDPATGRYTDANRAALRLYGYSRAELLRLGVSELSAEPEKTRQALRKAAARRMHRIPLRLQRRKDGSVFPVEITAGTFRVRGRMQIVCIVRDVTEHIKAQEAQRMEERERARKDLIANVSHELRTPVAAILGFAETLLNGAIEDCGIRGEFVGRIHKQAAWLRQIVEDLLAAAALESGGVGPRPAAVPLAEEVRRSAEAFRHAAGQKGISVHCGIPRELRAWVDQRHLSRVLQNLFDNAIKYNVPAGKVHIWAHLQGGKVRVSFADTGQGIPPEDLPRVFERFHRSSVARSGSVPGTGLGLALVKQLVEANGGGIWVSSVLGKGTVFQFSLPAAPADVPELATAC